MPREKHDVVKDGGIVSLINLCAAFETVAPPHSYHPHAQIGLLKGDISGVTIIRDGTAIDPNQNPKFQMLQASDRVMNTGARSATIRFHDNTELSLDPGHEMPEVSQCIRHHDEGQDAFSHRLQEGLTTIEAGDIAEIRGDTMSVKVRDDTNLAVTA